MIFHLIFLFLLGMRGVHGSPVELLRSENNVKEVLTSRIVGGVDAPLGYGKHMVALVAGHFLTFLTCGASIITKTHILSAAHCIDMYVIWGELSPSLKGVIGSQYWNSRDKIIDFTSFVIHPQWDWATIKYDIAVLTSDDIQLGETASIIPLNFDWITGGVNCFVTGWGLLGVWGMAPERLQLLYVDTVAPERCVAEVEAMGERDEWHSPPAVDPALEICTYHSPDHGMCNGDSGSGLILQETGEQIGIVSWGFPCAVGAPDIFVRISAFKDFLIEHVGESLLLNTNG